MRTVVRVNKAGKSRWCEACTQKATRHVVIGRSGEHFLNAASFYLCDDCAAKLARKLTGKQVEKDGQTGPPAV